MFSRLFRGKKRNRPQHSAQRTKQRPGRDQLGDADPERRLGALAAIGKPTDTEQRQIDELISEDPDVRVRRRAIELCQDQSLLLRLLEDDAVAEAAAGRLVALDPERTVNGALGGNHPAVLKALLGAGRLPDIPWLTDCDPETLLEFVLVSRGEAQQRLLEHAAFQQADNLTLLERASRDKVKNVNRFARDRLEGLKQLRAECDQLDQRLQELLAALEKHLAGDSETPGFHDKYDQLRQRLGQTFTALESALTRLAIHGEEPVPLAERRASITALPDIEPTQPAASEPEAADLFADLTDEVTLLKERLRNSTDLEALREAGATLSERWTAACGTATPSRTQQALFDATKADLQAISEAHQQLQQLGEIPGSLDFAATPTTEAEAADDYWRAVAAARKWLKTQSHLRASFSWPDWAPAPAQLEHFENQARELKERLSAIDEFCREQEQQLQDSLATLAVHIDAGETQAAQRLLGETRTSLRCLPHGSNEKFAKTLNQSAARLGELKDWQTFATRPKRQALCDAMASLIAHPLAPPDQAARIKELREQWNQLGGIIQAADRELAEEFNSSADRAFEPCREYFAEQAELRAANLAARQQICEQLERYLETTDWEHTDIKAAEKILRTARSEWRQFHPVDRKPGKPAEARFESLQQALHGHIKAQWDRNLAAKQQIVTEAKALLDAGSPVDECVETAKTLQRRWRDVGPTPRRPDQQLWQEFRTVCDEIFASRDAQKEQASAAIAAAEAAAAGLLDEFEAALTQPESSTKTLREFQTQFQDLPQLPPRLRQHFERRFEELERAHQARRQAAARAEKTATLQTLLTQDAAGSDAANEATDADLRRLVVLAEIAAELESAPEDRDLRMAIQVELMNQGGRQALVTDPRQLVDDWLASGRKPAGCEALQTRFSAAVAALSKR